MLGLLIAALALLPFAFDTGRADTPMERHRKLHAASQTAAASADSILTIEKYRLPCLPDTVEVIQQQILEPDTTMFNGMLTVTYKVILCNPTPGSLK